jgi:hypothetical protein
MKLSLALLALSATGAIAGRPNLSIQVRDGVFDDGAAALEPTLTWETSTKSGDITYDFGLEADARPTADLASLPKNFWGKASKSFGAWGVTARAEVAAGDYGSANLEINADNAGDDLSIKVDATAGGEFAVSKVEATKGFDSGDARVTVNPRFDVASKETDVVIGYSSGKTDVEVTASKEEQEVTVSQQLDADNKVSPSFALRSGKMSVEWERSLGDDNTITTTLKPSEEVEVEWADGEWTANVNLPIVGSALGGANVSVKREVNF